MSTLDLQGKKQRPGPQSALAGMLLCVGMLAAFGVIAGVSAAAPGEGWDSLRLHASHLLIGLVAGYMGFRAMRSMDEYALEVTITLPPSFIAGKPYFIARNGPRTFTAMTWSKTSSG